MKALALEKRASSSVELEIPLHIGPRDVKNCMHRGQNTAFRCGTQIMAEQLHRLWVRLLDQPARCIAIYVRAHFQSRS